ncbi:unnamed protein product [Ectocarpus sp. CCAP 1310/34]|nr:unnamed protein product [Ectocarpus sp. CCAP 1310/34]
MERTRVAGRKRTRPTPALRCHVVDDHCDALSKIHGAIRNGALPFTGLSAVHFDAHPDLMVTPDMPAETCFRPHELYDTLARTEGGIAEWILPMVYQGHLSTLWWVRPRWARQFTDGDHRFCVGQVKTTGKLRVSSTAPYFVDDRLYCREEDMKECKPLHLCVSLVPDNLRSPAECVSGAELQVDSVRPQSRVAAQADASDEGKSPTVAHGNGDGTEETEAKDRPTSPTPLSTRALQDYFTTENPFILELEDHIGKRDAAVVRDFFEKPRFRGAATPLPHETQLEHERIFKTEVDRLLGAAREDSANGAEQPSADTKGEAERAIAAGCPASKDLVEGSPGAARSRRFPGEVVVDGSTPVSEEVDTREEADGGGGGSGASEEIRGLRRLTELFDPDGEDRLLAGKFASVVGRIGREGRQKVAWADHCACLPRHLATREEVKSSVQSVEAFLRSLLEGGTAATNSSSSSSSANWSRRPGVITVARSEEDGYVPANMVAFVEQEVLAMLFRLYGGDGAEGVAGCGGGLEVCYEDGLEATKG